MVKLFIQQNILGGHNIFVKICVLATFFNKKKAGGERVNFKKLFTMIYKTSFT